MRLRALPVVPGKPQHPTRDSQLRSIRNLCRYQPAHCFSAWPTVVVNSQYAILRQAYLVISPFSKSF
jgi:hypothetical protein